MCAKLIFAIPLLVATLQSLSNAAVDIKIGVCVYGNYVAKSVQTECIVRALFIHSLAVVILRLSERERVNERAK